MLESIIYNDNLLEPKANFSCASDSFYRIDSAAYKRVKPESKRLVFDYILINLLPIKEVQIIKLLRVPLKIAVFFVKRGFIKRERYEFQGIMKFISVQNFIPEKIARYKL